MREKGEGEKRLPENEEKRGDTSRKKWLLSLTVTVILVFLALFLPGFILRQKGKQLDGELQTSDKEYATSELLATAYFGVASFYNRLMLFSGQWESREEWIYEVLMVYSEETTDAPIKKLSLRMIDLEGNEYQSEMLLNSGNAFRAVYNLASFELIPDEWNFFQYSSWILNQVYGAAYTDIYFGRYRAALYVLGYQDSSSYSCTTELGEELSAGIWSYLMIDEESGDFLGLRLQYQEETLKMCLLYRLYEELTAQLGPYIPEEETEEWERWLLVLTEWVQEHSAYEELFLLQRLQKLAAAVAFEYAGGGSLEEGLEVIREEGLELSELLSEETLSGDDGDFGEHLWKRLYETFLGNGLTLWLDRLLEERESNVVSFLEKLGYEEVSLVSGEELSCVIPLSGMHELGEDALVYNCTESETEKKFYFVINSLDGVFEVYFTPNAGNFQENSLTDETSLE